MAKRKRAGKYRLPKVAVLSMSPKALQAFVDAVERLGLLVNDLRGFSDILAAEINRLVRRQRGRAMTIQETDEERGERQAAGG